VEPYKLRCKVNIYGAFSGNRIKYLEKVRDYLRECDYPPPITCDIGLSTDLAKRYQKREDEDEDEYNRRISEKFLNEGDIHIFFFFKASKGEPDLNQSASIELATLLSRGEKERITLYFEKNSFGQVRTLLRGIAKSLDYDEFKDIQEILFDAYRFVSNTLHHLEKFYFLTDD